jgi:tellurite resistance protein
VGNRLPNVPASFFGIVLGLVGLGDCWRAAHLAWGTPDTISTGIMVVAGIVWLILLVLFAAKWAVRRTDAVIEANHPIQSCFLSLVGVSTLLMAYLFAGVSHTLAVVVFAVAAAGELAFGGWFTARLWRGGHDIETATPALYLPTVAANLVAAFTAAYLGYRTLAIFFFGAGILSWLALESQIGMRATFRTSLAGPLRPTLGILIAPPVVACEAYLFITGGTTGPRADVLTYGLIGYGLFVFLVLAMGCRWVLDQPLAASHWAFSFGITSLAFDLILIHARGSGGFVGWLAVGGFAIANLLVVVLAIGTVVLLVQRRLIPGPPPSSSLDTAKHDSPHDVAAGTR